MSMKASKYSKKGTKTRKSKPGKRFMKIRVLNPNRAYWTSIMRKRRYYYRVREGEGSKFTTLDVGSKGGLMFVRGVPKEINTAKVGEKIDSKDFRTQAIRIEYSKLGITDSATKKTKINAALRVYEKDIKMLLIREMGPIRRIEIVPKGKDFQLKIIR